MNIEELVAQIAKLEAEREAIYQDSQVTEEEHPRLTEIAKELDRLWDVRRRIEAAKAAGLDRVPVPPPSEPSDLIG